MDKYERIEQGNFIISWMIANFLGFFIGYIFFFIILLFSGGLGSPLPPEVQEQPEVAFEIVTRTILQLLPLFLGIAISQWIVLRSRIKSVDLWIPITILGYSILILILTGARSIGSANWPDPLLFFGTGALIGGVIGFMQWIVLRIGLKQPIAWIFINILSFSISMIFMIFTGPPGGIFGWLLSSLISGYWLKKKIESSLS